VISVVSLRGEPQLREIAALITYARPHVDDRVRRFSQPCARGACELSRQTNDACAWRQFPQATRAATGERQDISASTTTKSTRDAAALRGGAPAVLCGHSFGRESPIAKGFDAPAFGGL